MAVDSRSVADAVHNLHANHEEADRANQGGQNCSKLMETSLPSQANDLRHYIHHNLVTGVFRSVQQKCSTCRPSCWTFSSDVSNAYFMVYFNFLFGQSFVNICTPVLYVPHHILQTTPVTSPCPCSALRRTILNDQHLIHMS